MAQRHRYLATVGLQKKVGTPDTTQAAICRFFDIDMMEESWLQYDR